MEILVQFYSYFRNLTGCDQLTVTVAPGSKLADVLAQVHARFPALAALRCSTLVAVGVEYQDPDYVLKEGDAVSLFPPVQGG